VEAELVLPWHITAGSVLIVAAVTTCVASSCDCSEWSTRHRTDEARGIDASEGSGPWKNHVVKQCDGSENQLTRSKVVLGRGKVNGMGFSEWTALVFEGHGLSVRLEAPAVGKNQ